MILFERPGVSPRARKKKGGDITRYITRKATKPKSAETTVVCCRVPEELKESVKDLCLRYNVTSSELMKEFIADMVKHQSIDWWRELVGDTDGLNDARERRISRGNYHPVGF